MKYYFIRQKKNSIMVDLLESNFKSNLNKILNNGKCIIGKDYKYNDDDLSNVILKYSKCTNTQSEKVYSKRPKRKLKKGVSIGIASSKFTT